MLIPNGSYELVVADTEVRITVNNRQYLMTTLMVNSGEYKFKRLYRSFIPGTDDFDQMVSILIGSSLTNDLATIGALIFDKHVNGYVDIIDYNGKELNRVMSIRSLHDN